MQRLFSLAHLPPFRLLIFAASLFPLAADSWPSFRQENLEEAMASEKQYFAALAAADAITFQRKFEPPFVLLLDNEQKEEYFNLRVLAERQAFMRAYWKSHNPDPLLLENDWLLDFLRRCAYVQQNFPSPQPPYFDDRGKYYLRYGKPWYRYVKPHGLDLLPNESWSYRKVAADFLVHFVGLANGTFQEVPSLMDVIIGASTSAKMRIWAKLIHERAAVSPALAQASTKVNDLELPQLYRGQSGNFTDKVRRIVQDHEYEVHEAIEQAPIAVYNPVKADSRLDFSHRIAQFRAPDGQTRLEVAFLSPFKKNLLKNLDSLSEATLALEFGGMLRDQNFDSLAAARQPREIPIKLAARARLAYAVGHLSLLSPPLAGELTLQVQDKVTEKIGYAQQEFAVRDFRGTNLMISDIAFFAEPADATQRQLLPIAPKLNLELAPYPHVEIRKSLPVFCYFEIYNLKTAGVANAYEMTYRIISGKNREKKIFRWLTGAKGVAVSVTLTRPVAEDTATELIALNLKNVPTGTHLLEITATATNDRRLTASVQQEISIED